MRPVEGVFYYPFNYLNVYAAQPCENETRDDLETFTPQIDYRSEAEYFVFTGVTSMLFVLVAAGYYVFFEDRAKDATSTDVGLFSFPVVVRHLLFLKSFILQSWTFEMENEDHHSPTISMKKWWVSTCAQLHH